MFGSPVDSIWINCGDYMDQCMSLSGTTRGTKADHLNVLKQINEE